MDTNNAEMFSPKSLVEAIRFFADADNCHAFIVPLRWPSGITCPRCESAAHSFISTRKVWKCKACKKQFTVKLGTIMEDSPLGLDKWMTALWMIVNAKNGISSWEIHRAIHVTQKSAWFLLHRIRLAMESGGFKFEGEVEADETFIGGKARNMHADKRKQKITGTGGAGSGKAIVIGVLDRETRKVSTKHIPDTKRATVHAHVRANVMPGSAVYTDALPSYIGLAPDYVHEAVDHAVKYVNGSVHTNCLENYWSRLKRSLRGTYVSVEPFHLFRYLAEQAYRYNERRHVDGTVKTDGERFVGKRLTYKKLTGKMPPACLSAPQV